MKNNIRPSITLSLNVSDIRTQPSLSVRMEKAESDFRTSPGVPDTLFKMIQEVPLGCSTDERKAAKYCEYLLKNKSVLPKVAIIFLETKIETLVRKE
jgi:hypothetical protein